MRERHGAFGKGLISITGTTRGEDEFCRCDLGNAERGARVEALGLQSSVYGGQAHSINSIAKRKRYPPPPNNLTGLLAAALGGSFPTEGAE